MVPNGSRYRYIWFIWFALLVPVMVPGLLIHASERQNEPAEHDGFAVQPSVAPKSSSPVQIAKLPNDPLQANQQYLKLIHAEDAWNVATGNTSITIAIVDTGVDATHPDLKGNLVEGVNLLQPGKPPADDNGHGTNVAGIIAAIGNNDKGVSGLLWNAKIMPIKALGAEGNGDEEKLGEGIRYAVDHGAKIVVLSLGLNKYSAYMRDIMDYAENKGVPLVAAAGNEGKDVKYPAAYPTVLAVGGAAIDGRPESRSNFGQELDILAPWDVFTTAVGGRYEYRNGTSLAAPQVAAAAALIWAQHPDMTPSQIRSRLRQTAENPDGAGWTPNAGYGMLRLDRALSAPYVTDLFEPNDRETEAKALPMNKTSDASFSSLTDMDDYELQSSYAGTVHLHVAAAFAREMQVTVTTDSGKVSSYSFHPGTEDEPSFAIEKGITSLSLHLSEDGYAGEREVAYQITPMFTVYSDPFEDNDKPFKAFTLPSRSQSLTGTFDHMNDEDWYMLPVTSAGVLKIKVYVDTMRMDPVLTIMRKGQKETVYDRNSDGGSEETYAMNVEPGTYYIKIANIADYAFPVVGEYTLQVDFRSDAADPFEPNDKSYQATMVGLDTPYEGKLDTGDDVDWYRFRLNDRAWVTATMHAFADGNTLMFSLQDNTLNALEQRSTRTGDISWEGELPAGTYYIRINGNPIASSQPYLLTVGAETLVGGYRDISGHWAEQSIETLTGKGILSGYDNRQFRPDRRMTRAEAAAVLTRTFAMDSFKNKTYTDVGPDYWAYEAIMRASAGGVIDGYPDGEFRPGQWITRMEMVSMIGRAAGFHGLLGDSSPFADASATYWGAPLLREMKSRGLLNGYEDGSFQPEKTATRAEFASLLDKMLRNP